MAKHIRVNGARDPAQEELYTQIRDDGVCPFCPEHFRYHSEPTLWESLWWIVTTNIKPYEGTRIHLLFILKIHATQPGEITAQARIDLFDQIERARLQFAIPGSALVLRFGDIEWNGASVDHIHAHVPVGSAPEASKHKRIRVKVGYYDASQ